MATVDTSVNELIINKLTQEQYDNLAEKSPTELYFVTDAETLPDQTGNAGKFLQTDGENASWSEALVNLGAGNKNSLWLGSGTLLGSLNDAIVLYTGSGFVSVGNGAIAIGAGQANGLYSVCINGLKCAGDFAIQLGGKYTTNPDANTFKVGNANGNFEMMSADGTIPAERMLKTVDLVDSSVELDINTIYNAGEVASLSITFPTVDVRYTSQLNFTSGATATAFTAPDDIKWDGDSIVKGAFVPEINKRYVILFYYDGVNICAIARG